MNDGYLDVLFRILFTAVSCMIIVLFAALVYFLTNSLVKTNVVSVSQVDCVKYENSSRVFKESKEKDYE